MAERMDQVPDMQRDLRKVNRLIGEMEAQLQQMPQSLRFDDEEKLQQCLTAYHNTRDRIQARIDHATLTPAPAYAKA